MLDKLIVREDRQTVPHNSNNNNNNYRHATKRADGYLNIVPLLSRIKVQSSAAVDIKRNSCKFHPPSPLENLYFGISLTIGGGSRYGSASHE